MPDHAHALIRPLPDAMGKTFDLSAIMQGIKGSSSRAINKMLFREGRLWQKESFDRIVRDEAEFEVKMKYMWNNPVGAGLCSCPEDWEFFVRPEEKDKFCSSSLNRGPGSQPGNNQPR